MADGDIFFEGTASFAVVGGIQCVKIEHSGIEQKGLHVTIQDASGASNFLFTLADAGQLASEIFTKLEVSGDPVAKQVCDLLKSIFGNNRRHPDAPPK